MSACLIQGCVLMACLLAPAVGAQILTHRYSAFNEPNGSRMVTDAVASAGGTLKGGATLPGGKIVLNGTNESGASGSGW